MTKEIKLTQGKIAIVDDEDFERINKIKWSASKYNKNLFRAIGKIKGKRVIMSRMIMNNPKGYLIDHIDRNALNNKKSNLRLCNHSQNAINSTKNKNNTSGFKGVWWNKNSEVWQSAIMHKNKRYRLGSFEKKIDAVNSYNNKAKQLFREFAYIN